MHNIYFRSLKARDPILGIHFWRSSFIDPVLPIQFHRSIHVTQPQNVESCWSLFIQSCPEITSILKRFHVVHARSLVLVYVSVDERIFLEIIFVDTAAVWR